MRTIKITFALLAIVVLTVSGVQSNEIITDEPTFEQKSTNIDLLAHKKANLKVPTRG
ncbi:hypothetical protein J4050_02560 [Winogradskyella sp. DF17]|uniref:Uncharacterized protein n=1 Tax=Winogradskyella pelagia TaxID=2819984 RepID=A0ABS3SZH8_9FLAO|nr:hypothetical protein [Winogradskyella sp. DF17]MBO3115609.1 hypothetical protein [Winogradskyella sp. DF17]